MQIVRKIYTIGTGRYNKRCAPGANLKPDSLIILMRVLHNGYPTELNGNTLIHLALVTGTRGTILRKLLPHITRECNKAVFW